MSKYDPKILQEMDATLAALNAGDETARQRLSALVETNPIGKVDSTPTVVYDDDPEQVLEEIGGIPTPEPAWPSSPLNNPIIPKKETTTNYPANPDPSPNRIYGTENYLDDAIPVALAQAEKNIDQYAATSDFNLSELLKGVLHHQIAGDNYKTQLQSAEMLAQTSGRGLLQDIVKAYWINGIPDERKPYIRGLMVSEYDSIGSEEVSRYLSKMWGDDEKEGEAFSAIVDYAFNSRDVSDDLLNELRNLLVIENKPVLDPDTDESFSPSTVIENIADFWDFLKKDKDDVNQTLARDGFSRYVTYNGISLAEIPFYQLQLLNETQHIFKRYEDKANLEQQNLIQLREELIREIPKLGSDGQNFYLISLEPNEIMALRDTGSLRDLDTRTFLEALLLTKSDIVGSSLDNTARGYLYTQTGYAPSGNNARNMWTNLGLRPSHMDILTDALGKGVFKEGTTKTIAQMALDAEDKLQAEQALLQWKRETFGADFAQNNPIQVPPHLDSELIGDYFRLKHGFEPSRRDRSFQEKAIGKGLEIGSAGLGALTWVSELIADDDAKAFITNPDYDGYQNPTRNDSYATGYDSPWAQEWRDTQRSLFGVRMTGYNRLARTIGFSGDFFNPDKDYYNEKAEEYRNQGKIASANLYDAIGAYGEFEVSAQNIVNNWLTGIPTKLRAIPGPFEYIIPHPQAFMHEVQRLLPEGRKQQEEFFAKYGLPAVPEGWDEGNWYERVWRQGSPETWRRSQTMDPQFHFNGKYFTYLRALYAGASPKDREHLEDAVDALQFPKVVDGVMSMPNLVELQYLIDEQGFTIQEAINEITTFSQRMRRHLLLDTLQILDVGIAGGAFKLGAAGLTTTPRLIPGTARTTDVFLDVAQGIKNANRIEFSADAAEKSKQLSGLTDQIADRILILENEIRTATDPINTISAKSSPEGNIIKRRFTGGNDQIDFVDEVSGETSSRAIGQVEVPKLKEVSTNPIVRIWDKIISTPTVPRGRLPSPFNTIQNELQDLYKIRDRIIDVKNGVKNAIEVDDLKHINEAVLRAEYYWDTQDSFKALFRIGQTTDRAAKPATRNPNTWKTRGTIGPHMRLAVETHDDVGNPLGFQATKWVTNKIAGRTAEGPTRDLAQKLSYTSMLEVVGMVATRQLNALNPKPSEFLKLFEDIQAVGATDIEDWHQFAAKNNFGYPLREQTAQTFEIISEIDLEKLPSLKRWEPDGEGNLRKHLWTEVVEDGKKKFVWDRDPITNEPLYETTSILEWQAMAQSELQGEMSAAILKRLNPELDADELGQALALQNGINGFVSKSYLERPGYGWRNLGTNITSAIVDGFPVLESMTFQGRFAKEILGNLDLPTVGLSKQLIGTESSNLVVRGKEHRVIPTYFGAGNPNRTFLWTPFRKLIGGADDLQPGAVEKVIGRGWGGGLVPFITHDPFSFAREAAGDLEKINRMHQQYKLFYRYYQRLIDPTLFKNIMRDVDPYAFDLVEEQFPELIPMFIENLQNPNSYSITNTFKVVPTSDEDYVVSMMLETPQNLIRRLGLYSPHILDQAGHSILSKVMQDPMSHVPDAYQGAGPLTAAVNFKKAVDMQLMRQYTHLESISKSFNFHRNSITNALETFAKRRIENIDQPIRGNIAEPSEVFTNLVYMYGTVFDRIQDVLVANKKTYNWQAGTVNPLAMDTADHPFTGETTFSAWTKQDENTLKQAHDTALMVQGMVSRPIRALSTWIQDIVDATSDESMYNAVRHSELSRWVQSTGGLDTEGNPIKIDPDTNQMTILHGNPNAAFMESVDKDLSIWTFRGITNIVRDVLDSYSSSSGFMEPVPLSDDVRLAADNVIDAISQFKIASTASLPPFDLTDDSEIKALIIKRTNQRLNKVSLKDLSDVQRRSILRTTVFDVVKAYNPTHILSAQTIWQDYLGPKSRNIFSWADIKHVTDDMIEEGMLLPATTWKYNREEMFKLVGEEAFRPAKNFTGYFIPSPFELRKLETKLKDNLQILLDFNAKRMVQEPIRQKQRNDLVKDLHISMNEFIEDAFKLVDEYAAELGSPQSANWNPVNNREKLLETIHELLQGEGTGEYPGLIAKWVPQINDLAELYNLPTKGMDLRIKGRTTAEMLQVFPWHDFEGHNFEKIIAERGPTIHMLERLSRMLGQQIQAGGTGLAGKFVDSVNDATIRRLEEVREIQTTSRLDEGLIHKIGRDLGEVIPLERGRQEYDLDRDILTTGFPQMNVYDDVITSYTFDREQTLPLMNFISSGESELSLSIPIRNDYGILKGSGVIIPEGQTRDPSRARLISPAQDQIRSGEAWTLKDPTGKVKSLTFTGNENMLPAAYGMDPQRNINGEQIKDVIPQSIHLRQFLQYPPEGFVPVFTNDSWPMPMRRIGFFVRYDAIDKAVNPSAEEIFAFVKKLSELNQSVKAKSADVAKLTGHDSRGTHNTSGFIASWSGSGGVGEFGDQKWLSKKIFIQERDWLINEIDALEDTSSARYKSWVKERKELSPSELYTAREQYIAALKNVAGYLIEQWEKGGPPYGKFRIRSQAELDGARKQVIDLHVGLRAQHDLDIAGRAQILGGKTDADIPYHLNTLRIKKDQADAIINLFDRAQSKANDTKTIAMNLAAKGADWHMHDYSNTFNFDYMFRWFGPWQHFATRALAKMGLNLMEHPFLLAQITKFQQAVRDANREMGVNTEYFPVGLFMGLPFKLIEKYAPNPAQQEWARQQRAKREDTTVNINALTFYNDITDGFESGDRYIQPGEDALGNWRTYGKAGKAAETLKFFGHLALSPYVDDVLKATGQYGPVYDLKEELVGQRTKRGNLWLTALAALTGKQIPTTFSMSGKDIRAIDNAYAETAIQFMMEPEKSAEEFDFTMEQLFIAWENWNRIKFGDTDAKVELLDYFNFGKDMAGWEKDSSKDIHAAMDRKKGLKEFWPEFTSSIGGRVKTRIPVWEIDGREVSAYTFMNGYYDILTDPNLSKGAKRKQLNEYSNQHPFVKYILHSRKNSAEAAEVSMGMSVYFTFKDEQKLEEQREMDQLRVRIPNRWIDPEGILSTPQDPTVMTNEEYWDAATPIAKKYADAEKIKLWEIYESYNVNLGLPKGTKHPITGVVMMEEIHPATSWDSPRFGNRHLAKRLAEENLLNNPAFKLIFPDETSGWASSAIDILENMKNHPSQYAVSPEEFEEGFKEYAAAYEEKYGRKLDMEYFSVATWNAFNIQTVVQEVVKERPPSIGSEAWKEQYGSSNKRINVPHWDEYFEDEAEFWFDLQERDPDMYKVVRIWEIQNSDLEDVVDIGIRELMMYEQNDIKNLFSLINNLDPNTKSYGKTLNNAYNAMEEMWQRPTLENIMLWLEQDEYGSLWREQQDITEQEVADRVTKRLKTVELITFGDIQDGNYDNRIARLQSEFNAGLDQNPEDSIKMHHFLPPNRDKSLIINTQEKLDEFKIAHDMRKRIQNSGWEFNLLQDYSDEKQALYWKYYGTDPSSGSSRIIEDKIIQEVIKSGKKNDAMAFAEIFAQTRGHDASYI